MKQINLLVICLLLVTLNAAGQTQIDALRSFRLPSRIKTISNYSWKLYLMTDAGMFYWTAFVPDLEKGPFICSPLGNYVYQVDEKGKMIQYHTVENDIKDRFDVDLKNENFINLFFDGNGQDLYGVTNLGKLFRIKPGEGRKSMQQVHKTFVGYKVAWNRNLGLFLTSKARNLQYSRLDGKAPTATFFLDRNITAIQVEPARFDVLAGHDNGKVTIVDQALTKKKVIIPISTYPITAVAYHPVDHYLFAGDATGKVYVYDLRKKKVIFSKKGHAGAIDFRVLKNAAGKPVLLTVGADSEIKNWSLEKLPPDYHRIVAEKLAVSEEKFLKVIAGETQPAYELRTGQENLGRFLTNRRNDVVDSLAGTLKTQDFPSLIANGDSLTLEVKPFRPVTFYAGVGKVFLSSLDSLGYSLLEDNDFVPRKARLFFNNGKSFRFDSNAPVEIKKTEIPLKLAREIAEQEQVLKDELSKLVASMRKRGELNNVELSMESTLKTEPDSLGRDELNLHVTYMYRGIRAEGVSADYPSGKYRIADSRAASTLLDFLLSTANEHLWRHMDRETHVTFRLTGSTDKNKVSSSLPYDNDYGEFREFPYYFQGELAGLNVNKNSGIRENSQLGFLRTYGVRDYIEKVKNPFSGTKKTFEHYSEEGDGYGPEYRKVKIEIILHDIDKKNAGS